MTIERAATLLTPLFGALSTWLITLITKNFPGFPAISATDLTVLQAAAFVGAVTASVHWLHGRAQFTRSASALEALIKSEVAKVAANQQAGPALDDIEDLLKGHTDAIVQAIATAVHAPPSVAQIAEEILSRAVQAKPAAAPPLTTTEQAAAQTVTGGVTTPSPIGPGPVSA